MPDLIPPLPDLEEEAARLFALLPEGFPVRDPDAFSAFGTYLRLAAQASLEARAFARALAPQLLVTRATGAWLDEHARGMGLERKPARPARLLLRCVASASGTFPAGAWVGLGELRYRVQGPYAPDARVEAVSEGVGSRYTLPVGAVLYPVTVVPGLERLEVVEVLEAGQDEETDEELRARLLLAWPALGRGSTYHAYMSWALEVPEVRKVRVLDQHPRGQGTVDVVIAPARGLPTPELVARVQALVDERRPLTVDARARGPTPKALNLNLRLHRLPGSPPLEAWRSRALDFLHGLGIGETFWPSRLMDYLHDFGGLEAVEVLSPAAPVAAAEDELIVPGEVSVGE
ncbi:baseplate J/gp47 family protein [Thermus sp. PS18]|uniref:baseplate J/gp47 family protein n=1 Tax=Thermus sp. PS18 TaxID=2849039 RepID=UPI0022644166|nr:baseplate J/gp47 family protein [Thermus sp. PS18]UZX14993.1 baseplate J/gp47 family protein [Thermus sp. PS18]